MLVCFLHVGIYSGPRYSDVKVTKQQAEDEERQAFLIHGRDLRNYILWYLVYFYFFSDVSTATELLFALFWFI